MIKNWLFIKITETGNDIIINYFFVNYETSLSNGDLMNLVIYHDDCTDGLAAAYAAWKKFKENAKYLPYHHQKDLTLEKLLHDIKNLVEVELNEINLYVIDFSFKSHIWCDLKKLFKTAKIIDHHQSAYDDLKHDPDCFFDMKHSGSYLAWKEFVRLEKIPYFIELIEDFDLFKLKFEDTKYLYRALSLYPKTFEFFEKLENEEYLNQLLKEGKLLQKYFKSQIDIVLKNKKVCSIDKEQGVSINAPGFFASEIGELLSPLYDYVLIWSESQDMIKCSLRSGENFDCSKIAKKYGGGGHPCASAFSISSIEEMNMIVKK